MYELDKVLQDSNQPIDAYLKQVSCLTLPRLHMLIY